MFRARSILRFALISIAFIAALYSIRFFAPLTGDLSLQRTDLWRPLPVQDTTSPGSAVVIPNLVHYVWALKEPEGSLEFQFKHFVSIYSSYLYLSPDVIYIHTNARPSAIETAQHHESSFWTHKVFEIPGVVVRHIEVPTHTKYGGKLEHMEHRSDFVRPGILRDFGGMYLDFDVVPIRDMKPLRESGFRNVFGHEFGEKVNNGVMLSVKGSRFMDVFDRDQHEVFSGWWIEHSVLQLTRMANALMAVPNEVLILERHAFIPDGFDDERHARLFRIHAEPAMGIDYMQISLEDMDDEGFSYWNWSKSRPRQEWERDYSKSYTIHALSPPLHVANRTPDCLEISWDYVMERTSNYAAQIYPAMLHADNKLSITAHLAGKTHDVTTQTKNV